MKKQIDHTAVAYRQCFSTEAGKKVLANMLVEAKFFEHIDTPEERAVENFMKTVLCKTGGYCMENVDEYVENLMKMKME